MSEMNKAEICRQLEAMVWHRLFNCRQWLADRETIYAVNLKLTKMGLVEPLSSDTWTTPQGKEFNVDLFEAFMGSGCVGGAIHPRTSSPHRTSVRAMRVCARMSTKANPEFVLVGFVEDQRTLIIARPTSFYTRE